MRDAERGTVHAQRLGRRRGAVVAAVVLAAIVAMIAVVRWDPAATDDPGSRARLPRATPAPGRATRKERAARPEPPAIGATSALVSAADVASDATPAPAPVDLAKADRDLDLHGVVVRADGSPVAGATIETFTRPWRDLDSMNYAGFDERIAGPSTRTSTDGTFAVRLRRGDAVSLVVRAAGLRRVELPSRRAGERVRVVLDDGVTLRVRARGPDGAPAGGVTIRAVHSGRHDVEVSMDARADADGRCTFAGLPPDTWVYVMGQRGAPHRVAFARVALPATGTTDAEVVVTPAQRLTGRVIGADGDPIADAEVALDEDFPLPVATGADGRFVLDGWSGEPSAEVHARAAGFAQRGVATTSDDVEIRLTPAASARGRIVDSSGAPLAGALVSLVGGTANGDRPWPVSTGHATSSADGTFEIGGLDASLAHLVVAGCPGHGRVLAPVKLEPGTSTTDLGDVMLPASRTVTGRVLGAGDAPMARTVVWMVPSCDDPARPIDRPRGSGQRETATDDLGRFAFADCGPGGHTVLVRSSGAPEASCRVQVPGDADPAPVVIRLTIKGEVTVRVVDVAGAPVGGVWVRLSTKTTGTSSAMTAADGTVKLAIGGDGAMVQAIPSASIGRTLVAPAAAPIAVSQTTATIVLLQGRPFGGRVVDAEGKPLGRAILSIRQPGRAPAEARTGVDGSFRTVVGVEGGVEVVFDGIVTRAGGEGGPREVDADCGLVGTLGGIAPGTTDAVLRCERRTATAEIVFRALAPDGSPLAGARLSYGAKATGVGGFVTTGADGSVRVPGLAPRTYTLAAMPCREFSPPSWVDFVPAGQEIVLRWRESAALSGTAAFDDGTIPDKADVRVSEAANPFASDDLGRDGSFRFRVPAGAGPWRVVVRGTDATGAFEGVAEDVAAPTESLHVRLVRR